jgi:SnoaL-like domain
VALENVELVRTAVEAWNAGDHSIETMSRYCDPSLTLYSPFAEMSGQPYRGYAGLRQWIRDVDDQFAEWNITTDDIREVGDRVVAITTVTGRGRGSGVTLTFASSAVFEFGRDGRINLTHIYRDARGGLDATGLEE